MPPDFILLTILQLSECELIWNHGISFQYELLKNFRILTPLYLFHLSILSACIGVNFASISDGCPLSEEMKVKKIIIGPGEKEIVRLKFSNLEIVIRGESLVKSFTGKHSSEIVIRL